MKTRFVIHETDPDTLSSSVLDIVELDDRSDDKKTRRMLMTQLGFYVDGMLEGTRGYDHITIEREKS